MCTGLWHLTGHLTTISRRLRGLRKTAFVWATSKKAYRLRDGRGIWYDGYQGVRNDAPDEMSDTPLHLHFDLYFREETDGAQAHGDLFAPKESITAWHMFDVGRDEDDPVLTKVELRDDLVAVKLSDYKYDLEYSPGGTESARSASDSACHLDEKIKVHSYAYQNLMPAVGYLAQHMHLVSRKWTARDKKRKAGREDDHVATDVPYADIIRRACRLDPKEPLLWIHVRDLDRNTNNFLYASADFHTHFDAGTISVCFLGVIGDEKVCKNAKGEYGAYEVAIKITVHAWEYDMSAFFHPSCSRIGNNEYKALVTVTDPICFEACLDWKLKEGTFLRDERAKGAMLP